MTIESLLEEIRALSPVDRQRLMRAIESIDQPSTTKKRSILEFGKMGIEMRNGIDPQEYINKLREEWDKR